MKRLAAMLWILLPLLLLPLTAAADGETEIEVSSVTLRYAGYFKPGGYSGSIVATVLPEDAADKSLTWTSSDGSVVTVSDGSYTCLKPGNAVITATSANGKSGSAFVFVYGALALDIDEELTLDYRETAAGVGRSSGLSCSATLDGEAVDGSAENEVLRVSLRSAHEAEPDTLTLRALAPGTASVAVTVRMGGLDYSLRYEIRVLPRVLIDEAAFPDAVFRAYIGQTFDLNQNGWLEGSEAEKVSSLDICSKSITSLDGLEYFTNLRILNCSDNPVETLDVTSFPELFSLNCTETALTSLDVSSCAKLKYLYCSKTPLLSLNVGGCGALEDLRCTNTPLTGLNVSSCAKLRILYCYASQLAALDVSGLAALKELRCYSTPLLSLNVGGCGALEVLHCYDTQLAALDVSDCEKLRTLYVYDTQLAALDVSGLSALTNLSCCDTPLLSLTLTGCTALRDLRCFETGLTALALGDCAALKELRCFDARLEALDLSACAELTYLNCKGNPLSSLNVGACTELSFLGCNNCGLASLDLSACAKLESLYCYHNPLSALDVSACTELSLLSCYGCGLSTLTLSGCEKLSSLWCFGNELTALALDSCQALQLLNCKDCPIGTLVIGACPELLNAFRTAQPSSADGAVLYRLDDTHYLRVPASTRVIAAEVESLSLPNAGYVRRNGDTLSLTLTVLPEAAAEQEFLWTSADESIAAVDNGAVSCLKPGNTVITAASANGLSASCFLWIDGYVTVAPGETLVWDYQESLNRSGFGMTASCSAGLGGTAVSGSASNGAVRVTLSASHGGNTDTLTVEGLASGTGYLEVEISLGNELYRLYYLVTVRIPDELIFGEAELLLPAGLEEIGESAFEGVAARTVELPEGCRSIGAYAFRDSALRKIRVPAACRIDDTAFDGCEKVVVFGTAGSPAEEFCRTHANCVFVTE